MLHLALFIDFLCVVHIVESAYLIEEARPQLRNGWVHRGWLQGHPYPQSHPEKLRLKDETRVLLPKLTSSSAKARLLKSQTAQRIPNLNPSHIQSRGQLLHSSHLGTSKGAIRPHVIPSLSKYESEQNHILTKWDDAKNVILTNISPSLTQGKIGTTQIDLNLGGESDLLTAISSPFLSEQTQPINDLANTAYWKKTHNNLVTDLKPYLSNYKEQNRETDPDYDDVKNLLLPNSNPELSKSKQQELASWQDLQGHFYSGLTLPNNPKLWKPPSYFQSLREIEDAVANIKLHFTVDEKTPKTDPRYKYIAVVHVIEGLTQEVTQSGWDTYNKNYDELVLKLLENISRHPEETMAETNCVFDASVKKIQRIKKLMTNQWVDYLCKAQPCACDTLVYAIVKMSDDEELGQEAELLLLLGLAASDYLEIYSRVFEAVSKQNVYLFLMNSKETLRTLIYKNSLARRRSSFSLKDQCYAEHALPDHLS